MGQANTQDHDINEQLHTIIDIMYSELELNLTSCFSMHSTAEILFDRVDLIYSFSIIYLFYYYYFKR